MKKFVLSLFSLLLFSNLAHAMTPDFGNNSSYEELKSLPIESYTKDSEGFIKPKISRDGEAVCPNGYKCSTINYVVRCVENKPTEQPTNSTNKDNNGAGNAILNTAGSIGVGVLRGVLGR